MKMILQARHPDESIIHVKELEMLDDAVDFLDNFLKAAGYCYDGQLDIVDEEIENIPDYKDIVDDMVTESFNKGVTEGIDSILKSKNTIVFTKSKLEERDEEVIAKANEGKVVLTHDVYDAELKKAYIKGVRSVSTLNY